MAEQPLVILSAGAVASVGLTLPEAAASVRGTTARLTMTEWVHKGGDFIVVGQVPASAFAKSPDTIISDSRHSLRALRMVQLAKMALVEALKPLRAPAPKLPVLLAMPELPDRGRVRAPEFLKSLALLAGDVFDMAASRSDFRGRAGALVALQTAGEMIRKGSPAVLVGGVDSLVDVGELQKLDAGGRLKSSQNLDGFVAGEGAAFVLVTTAETAANKLAPGIKPLARLSAVQAGMEPGHFASKETYRGEGLSGAVAKLFDSATGAPVQAIWSTMNGEGYWGKEWGVTVVRNGGRFGPSPQMHHPADCYGETGAAAGALLLALAAHGIQAGYRKAPALIYGSSDDGPRAAVMAYAMEGK